MSRPRSFAATAVVLLVAALAIGGCRATPIGATVGLVGFAANEVDVREKAEELMGASTEMADASLGRPMDVFRGEGPGREWRMYAVQYDALKKYRYVLEMRDGRVIAISKVDRRCDIALDMATRAILDDEVEGYTPQQCQANLEQGPPLLSVRSAATGQLVQLYDASAITEIQRPYYISLWFGPSGTCEEFKMGEVAASTKDQALTPF